MTLIDGDKIVTAQLYDDEHDEFTEKKMSIIEYVNAYTDEGVTIADEVLDKIRAEIESLQNANPSYWHSGDMVERDEVFEIIDHYKQESDHKCHTCKHYTSGENDGSCGSYICKGYSNWESEVRNDR